MINLNTQETLISTGDLDFDTGWGIRAGFGVRPCDGWGWEFEYLGVFDQDAGRSIELADELALPGDLGLATNNFFFADEVSVRYESQVNNAEVNRVCCCCCCDGPCCCRSVTWLYGFRYLNLNEDFAIVSTDLQEGTSTYDIDTNNNLIGGQVGSRVRQSRGRWSWEGTGKAGLFGNAAEQHSDPIIDFPNFVIRPGRTESAGNLAFVGDFNLSRDLSDQYRLGGAVRLQPDLDRGRRPCSGSTRLHEYHDQWLRHLNRRRCLTAWCKRRPRSTLVSVLEFNVPATLGRKLSAELREERVNFS